MFNVIPPIASRKTGFAPQQNIKFAQTPNNLAPLKSDTTSFTGAEAKLLNFEQICKKYNSTNLYLSESKITRLLRKTKTEKVMDVLSQEIANVVAKRLDHLNMVPKAEAGAFSHPPFLNVSPLYSVKSKEPSTFTFHPKKEYSQRFSMDWTEQYNDIKNILEETGKKSDSAATKYDVDAAKARLHAEFKKLTLLP